MRFMKYFAVILAFILLLSGTQRLLEPKYMTGVYDGALIAEYYKEAKNHEVVFIGDCEVYENFSPAELFRSYGITSYIRGSAQQLIWQSYYLLEDTLRYETPKVVVFNVLSMQYKEPQSEEYNRLNLDGMRLSLSKIRAVNASVTEGESKLSYLFPLLRYHDRWRELDSSDFKYFFTRNSVGHNGYLMRNDAKPLTIVPEGKKLASYELSGDCWAYLDKMRELCAEKGITLVLIKAPTIWPHWYEEWSVQLDDYAARHGLHYYNMLTAKDLEINWDTDTYDAGLHMNLAGAEKCARWIGAKLSEISELEDCRENAEINKLWEEKIAMYERMKEIQFEELKRDGKISTYIY